MILEHLAEQIINYSYDAYLSGIVVGHFIALKKNYFLMLLLILVASVFGDFISGFMKGAFG